MSLMVWVVIDDGVMFNSTDMLVRKSVLNWTPERLHDAVRRGYSHMEDSFLIEACCGGENSLSDAGEVTYEEYIELKRVADAKSHEEVATIQAKRKLTKERRKQFQPNRDSLALAMINGGVPYKCANDGCHVTKNLSVDHIVPLSRGGSDELSNLQFLCHSHNSLKSDKL